MLKNPQSRRLLFFVVIILVFLISATFANMAFVRSRPGGNNFLGYWTGGQSFLRNGSSPYSEATALQVQNNIYGRAALPGEPEYRVTYPLYSLVLFAPFALINDFNVARALWMTLLEGCLLGIAILGLKFVKGRSPLWLVLISFFFVIFSYHGIRPLVDGNVVIVITLLIAFALYSIVNKRDEVAGVSLAFAMIMPQIAWLVVIFVLIWAIVQHRRAIVSWFLGMLILLIGFSLLLIPDWIVQNIREVLRSISNNPPGSPGAFMIQAWGEIGMRLSIFFTVLLAGILLIEWIGAFKGDSRHLLWTAFLTLAFSQWIGLQTEPGNFILLFPGILFCFDVLLLRWGAKVKPVLLGIVGFLMIIVWVLYIIVGNNSPQALPSAVLFLPTPLVAILLLYWTKWWTIRPLSAQDIN